MTDEELEKRRAYYRVYNKQWRQKNPEKYRAAKRASRQRHHDKRLLQEAAYRQAHREEMNAKQAQRYKQNRMKILARHAVYRKKHWDSIDAKRRAKRALTLDTTREYERLYARERRQKHPAQIRATEATAKMRRKARQQGLPDTFSVAQNVFMMQYWSFACAACGRQEGFMWTLAIDHWIPLNSPNCPGTVAWNLVPLCHGIGGCNNSKKNREASSWLQERFGPRKAGQILKVIVAYFALVTPH